MADSDIISKIFLTFVEKGNFEECKKQMNAGANINYQSQEEGNSFLFVGAMHNQLDILRYLVSENEADIDYTIVNAEGNTPLHYACEQEDKQMILFLLMAGIDPDIKNNAGQKAGEKSPKEIKDFVTFLKGESKAFKALNQQQKRKLLEIFKEIDYDNSKFLDNEKSQRFNKFIEGVEDHVAEKDANEFIKECAICNKASVNQEEWLFAFSKLMVVDEEAYLKFIEDYDTAVSTKGKLSNWISS